MSHLSAPPFPRRRSWLLAALAAGGGLAGLAAARPARGAPASLLNVSYDVSREFYKELNAVFAAHWQQATGQALTLNQSHGGSQPAGARRDRRPGRPTSSAMNQANDIDILTPGAACVPLDWAQRLPDRSAPTTFASGDPGAPGQPEAASTTGLTSAAPMSPWSSRTRRPAATAATPTWRPGARR